MNICSKFFFLNSINLVLYISKWKHYTSTHSVDGIIINGVINKKEIIKLDF